MYFLDFDSLKILLVMFSSKARLKNENTKKEIRSTVAAVVALKASVLAGLLRRLLLSVTLVNTKTHTHLNQQFDTVYIKIIV